MLYGSYLEFVDVSDETLFSKTSSNHEKIARKQASPFGVAARVSDMENVYSAMLNNFPHFAHPEIHYLDEGGISKPTWSVATVPTDLLEAPTCYLVEYLRPRRPENEYAMGDNAIVRIEGLSFLSNDPENAALKWAKILTPISKPVFVSPTHLLIAGQHFIWHTGEEVTKLHPGWKLHSVGEREHLIYGVILQSVNIEVTTRHLQQAGFDVLPHGYRARTAMSNSGMNLMFHINEK